MVAVRNHKRYVSTKLRLGDLVLGTILVKQLRQITLVCVLHLGGLAFIEGLESK